MQKGEGGGQEVTLSPGGEGDEPLSFRPTPTKPRMARLGKGGKRKVSQELLKGLPPLFVSPCSLPSPLSDRRTPSFLFLSSLSPSLCYLGLLKMLPYSLSLFWGSPSFPPFPARLPLGVNEQEDIYARDKVTSSVDNALACTEISTDDSFQKADFLSDFEGRPRQPTKNPICTSELLQPPFRGFSLHCTRIAGAIS